MASYARKPVARKRTYRKKKAVQPQTVVVQAPAPRARKPRMKRIPKTSVAQQASSGGGILSSIGRTAGGLIGGPAGGAIGELLGKGASSLFKFITGHGDYKIRSNSLVGGGGSVAMDSLPKFMTSDSGVRIVHREYLNDVISNSSASTFNIQALAVQPAYTFPWLSTVAQQFQQYRINGMIFEFKTTSSDALNSTNTALGEVALASQYNVLTSAPVNMQQMYQLEYVTTCKPSESVLHPIECARGESPFIVLDTRNGNAASISSADLRLYDFANFYIATNGMQGTSVNLGQLWVSYDITLLKPYLGSIADVGDHFDLQGQIANISNTAFFGTSNPVAQSTSDLGCTVNASNNTITIPSWFTGNIMIMYGVDGASTASVAAPSQTNSAGLSALPIWRGPPAHAGFNSITPGGTVSILNCVYFFKVVAGGTFTFTSGTGTLPGTISSADLYVISWPSTLIN